MTQAQAEPLSLKLLRDIIEGDDAVMSAALDEGRKLLHMLRVSGARHDLDHLDIILALAASHHGYTIAMMATRERTARIVLARQVGMWLCRHVTNASLMEIGNKLDRDHGTVIHGVAAVQNLADTDPKFKAELIELRTRAAALCGRARA